MEYKYKGRDTSEFNLIDVSELKYRSSGKRDDLYKIVWAMNDELTLGIDGYRVLLQKKPPIICYPFEPA